MSSTCKIQIPNGKDWWVGCEVVWDSEAHVIVPIEQLEGMTDEEIGQAVRSLVRTAQWCQAEEYADRIIKHPDLAIIKGVDLQHYRAVMAPFANEFETIQKALMLLDAGLPHRRPRNIRQGRHPQQGYIYLLYSEYGYKIGKSKDIPTRMRTFGLQLPFPTELIHTIQTNDMAWAEEYLHAAFAHGRINGEWFNLSADEVARICKTDTLNPENEQA